MQQRTLAVSTVLGIFLLLSVSAEEAGKENVYELDEITVTGTRTEKRLKDSPVTTEIISEKEIDNSDASTLTDILEDYGLVFTGNAMGDYVQLQGTGESRILYLIDGRRIVGRVAQRMSGDTLPLGNIERIEIVRGPQSALYGSDGIGGVINIITKKPKDKVSASISLTNRFLLAYDDPDTDEKAGKFDDFNPVREQTLSVRTGFPLAGARNSLAFEGARGDYYYAEQKGCSLLPKYYRGRLGLDTACALGDVSEVRVGGSFMLMRSDEKTNSLGSFTRQDILRGDGYIEGDAVPLEGLSLTARVYDNFYQRDKDSYSALLSVWDKGNHYENENLLAAEVFGTYDAMPGYLFTLGIEAAYQSMNKYNLEMTDKKAEIDKEALVLQAERVEENRYSAVLGLRLERNSQFGMAVAPKISGMIHLLPGFRLLGGVGIGYRAPDFNDLYLVKQDSVAPMPNLYGNEDLDPEYSVGANLGLEYAAGPLSLRTNYYYTELYDEIAYVDQGTFESGKAVYRSENISRSMRTGVDCEGKAAFLSHGFLTVGYGFVYAYDRTEEEELHIQPAHTVRAKLGLDRPRSKIHAYLLGRFFSPLYPDDSDYDSRLIIDFFFSAGFGKNVKGKFTIENLTGQIDKSLGPYTGQTFSFGIQYSL